MGGAHSGHLTDLKGTCIWAGGMAGGFFATNIGGTVVLGIEGWRCAFHFVALVSVSTSLLVMWLAVDPRSKVTVRLPHFSPGSGNFTAIQSIHMIAKGPAQYAGLHSMPAQSAVMLHSKCGN